MFWKRIMRGNCRQFVISIIASICASAIVGMTTYYLLRDNIAAIVEKSLHIIRFDRAIATLQEVSEYQWSEDASYLKERIKSSEDFDKIKTHLEDVNQQIDALTSEFEQLVRAFEKLPINDRPMKLFDEELVVSPQMAYKDRLRGCMKELLKVRESIHIIPQLTNKIPQLFEDMEKAYAAATNNQLVRLIHKVDSARTSLVSRRDAMLEVLEEFGKKTN